MSARIQSERQASALMAAPVGGWTRDDLVRVERIVGIVWETALVTEQVNVCYRAEKASLPVAGANGSNYAVGSVAYYDVTNGGTLTTDADGGANPPCAIILVQPESGDADALCHLMGDMAVPFPLVSGLIVESDALGTSYGLFGTVDLTGDAISGGNARGVRGNAYLTGQITAGGAYVFGSQGKLIVGSAGVMNHADARLAGGYSQLDISQGTFTAGQLSGHWVDMGATASASAIATKGGGQCNVLRLQNTTAMVPNAIIYGYSKADFVLELGAPGGTADWFNASDTLNTPSCTLKMKGPNGSTFYVQGYST